ncbi:MAG: hypothetical protein GQ574_05690 [Crocinitomix sp.]|nr:hypothetical protein [Crocinitomix sp.]
MTIQKKKKLNEKNRNQSWNASNRIVGYFNCWA